MIGSLRTMSSARLAFSSKFMSAPRYCAARSSPSRAPRVSLSRGLELVAVGLALPFALAADCGLFGRFVGDPEPGTERFAERLDRLVGVLVLDVAGRREAPVEEGVAVAGIGERRGLEHAAVHVGLLCRGA